MRLWLLALVASGCWCGPLGPQEPQRVRDPSKSCLVTGRAEVDFGVLPLGTKRAMSISVANRADFDVVAFVGVTAPFTVTPSRVALRPGAVTDVTVEFTATDGERHTATLFVDDPEVVNGCAATTRFAATGGGRATWDAFVDLGAADPGQTVEGAFHVDNDQHAPLLLRGLTTSGVFSLVGPSSLEVAAKTTAAITLRATVPAEGVHRGELRFVDAAGTPVTIPLVVAGASPRATLDSTRVDFARVGLFSTGGFADRRVFLRNTGRSGAEPETKLRLTGAARVEPLDGAPAGELTVDPTGAAMLGQGERGVVALHLEPSSVGARRWRVTLPTNDPTARELSFEVHAQVEAPPPCTVSVVPSALQGLELVAGRGEVTFTNTSANSCLVDDVRIDGDGPFFVEGGDPMQLVLPPGGRHALVVCARSTGGAKVLGTLRWHVVARSEGVTQLLLAATVP